MGVHAVPLDVESGTRPGLDGAAPVHQLDLGGEGVGTVDLLVGLARIGRVDPGLELFFVVAMVVVVAAAAAVGPKRRGRG